jgi:acyl homoserine lactone synthase
MVGQQIEISILQFPQDCGRWNLVTRFFELRKAVFVDRMHWDLYHRADMEFEQYDYFGAVYVIAHRDDEVVGGARLIRTDWAFGSGKMVYSYMIRDAFFENLPGLPSDICADEPPVDPRVWELTRLTATQPGVAELVLSAVNVWLRQIEATRCLFLGPPAFLRMAQRMGFEPKPMGSITGNRDGRFLAFSCAVV